MREAVGKVFEMHLAMIHISSISAVHIQCVGINYSCTGNLLLHHTNARRKKTVETEALWRSVCVFTWCWQAGNVVLHFRRHGCDVETILSGNHHSICVILTANASSVFVNFVAKSFAFWVALVKPRGVSFWENCCLDGNGKHQEGKTEQDVDDQAGKYQCTSCFRFNFGILYSNRNVWQ